MYPIATPTLTLEVTEITTDCSADRVLELIVRFLIWVLDGFITIDVLAFVWRRRKAEEISRGHISSLTE